MVGVIRTFIQITGDVTLFGRGRGFQISASACFKFTFRVTSHQTHTDSHFQVSSIKFLAGINLLGIPINLQNFVLSRGDRRDTLLTLINGLAKYEELPELL